MNMSVIRPKKSALVAIDDIDCPANARPHHADQVSALAKSIRPLGLQSPPTVVEREGRYKLVAGRHRLEARRVIGVGQFPSTSPILMTSRRGSGSSQRTFTAIS